MLTIIVAFCLGVIFGGVGVIVVACILVND